MKIREIMKTIEFRVRMKEETSNVGFTENQICYLVSHIANELMREATKDEDINDNFINDSIGKQ